MTDPEPRVLLFSQRGMDRLVFHATQFEFEDVVADVDRTTLLAPPPPPMAGAARVRRGVRNRLRRRAGLAPASGMEPPRVPGRHDLFFGVFHFADELAHLHHLEAALARCERRIAFVIELWAPWVERDRDYLRALRGFDHVFLFSRWAGSGLTALTGVPTTYLPTATDTLRFTPGLDPPARVVDVLSYGRRTEEAHQALLRVADETGRFYSYQTLWGPVALSWHREHRRHLADVLRRSRFALVERNNDVPHRREKSGGEEALTTRYFETTAAGAVVLGSAPDTGDFTRNFDWPDVLIPLPDDLDGLRDLLAGLERQPDRLRRARLAGIENSLRRHDWVHRWGEVLDVAGLPATPGMTRRLEVLEARAARVASRLAAG